MIHLGVPLFCLVALTACEPALGRPTTAPGAVALADTAWQLVAVDGEAPDSLVGGEAQITIGFSEGPPSDLAPEGRSLGGYDGCNDFGIAYRLDGDPEAADGAAFRAGAVWSNAMACGDPGTHVSDHVHAGFGATRRLRLRDGYVVFIDSLGAERLAFVPRPARSVDSAAVVTGRWRLDPAASTVTNSYGGPAGRYTVAFAPDGTYQGEAGCLTFSGTYSLRGDRLGVSSYARDDASCAPEDRHWDGPHGLDTGEVEAGANRLVVYRRTGPRAVFRRP